MQNYCPLLMFLHHTFVRYALKWQIEIQIQFHMYID